MNEVQKLRIFQFEMDELRVWIYPNYPKSGKAPLCKTLYAYFEFLMKITGYRHKLLTRWVRKSQVWINQTNPNIQEFSLQFWNIIAHPSLFLPLHRVHRHVRPQYGLLGRARGHGLRAHGQQLPLVLQRHGTAHGARHAAAGRGRRNWDSLPFCWLGGREKWRRGAGLTGVVKLWGDSRIDFFPHFSFSSFNHSREKQKRNDVQGAPSALRPIHFVVFDIQSASPTLFGQLQIWQD